MTAKPKLECVPSGAEASDGVAVPAGWTVLRSLFLEPASCTGQIVALELRGPNGAKVEVWRHRDSSRAECMQRIVQAALNDIAKLEAKQKEAEQKEAEQKEAKSDDR